MKLTITGFFASILMASSLSACGACSDETKLEIQMYGVARAPASATGDRDPQFQSYTVQSIVLNSAEGDVSLIDAPSTFKIVDRPQILLKRIADEWAGRTFTGLTVTFDATVVGGDNDDADLSFTLSAPVVALTQTLLLEENKGLNFTIKAVWANTIAGEAMTEPTFEIVAQ
ncbi:MAG: hypothetical protein EOP10_22445 [Proteobacteria bacterium]|nr:MAG: hypothetical protein EOP10_22445 [Pseudomonadota bacterium]